MLTLKKDMTGTIKLHNKQEITYKNPKQNQ